MKLYTFEIFITIIIYVKAVSLPLENGSFDAQTYGKDGVVLFYNIESENILPTFLSVAEKYEEDENIHFWHVNCDFAVEFCKNREKIKNVGLPAMLYSFRNELWNAQGCKTYNEHAFETFFNTKLQENCLNTPILCSSIMNITLKEHGDKSHAEIKKLYLEEKKEGDSIEEEWETLSNNIQNQWNNERTKFVVKLRNSDDKLKIYKMLMEQLHSTSYEKNEGEVQQILIDMTKKYL